MMRRLLFLGVIATLTALDFVTVACGKGDYVDTISENTARENGKCGEDLYWELNEGTFTISGTGYMDNYTSISKIPWYSNRSSITNVLIREGVVSIGIRAFYDCYNLVNVTLADSITSIGEYAFYYCGNLVNIKLSNKLERIDYEAFYDCRKLTNITLPKSLKYIGFWALYTHSRNMSSIDVEDGNEYFKSIDGVLFNYNLTELIQYPPGKTDIVNYVIPETVKTIGAGAFVYSQLMNVTIPSGIKVLNDFVFLECNNLTCVVIPEGVESIGSQAFGFCSNLGNITIPETMINISNDAFNQCTNLKSVLYQGYTPILSKAFESFSSLSVCTPNGYTSDDFCGKPVTPSTEICQTYQNFFSRCTKGSCVDGVVVEQKWDNVTKWEQQTNECAQYQCDEVNGLISWWKCNMCDEVKRVCVNGQCMIESEVQNDGWTVELKMNNYTWNQMNESEIMEILTNVTGINEMKIGTEVDDKGNVLRIIIYVKDESVANIIAETVKKHELEVFRKAVNVHLKCHDLLLSCGHHTMTSAFLLLFMMTLTKII